MCEVNFVPVQKDGRVLALDIIAAIHHNNDDDDNDNDGDDDDMETTTVPVTVLVTLMLANNKTVLCNPFNKWPNIVVDMEFCFILMRHKRLAKYPFPYPKHWAMPTWCPLWVINWVPQGHCLFMCSQQLFDRNRNRNHRNRTTWPCLGS